MAKRVKFVGGDASLDEGFDVVEDFPGQTPGYSHFFDFIRGLDADAHGGCSVVRWSKGKDK
jgi:hypothetical protein